MGQERVSAIDVKRWHGLLNGSEGKNMMKRRGCVWLVLVAIAVIGYWWFFSRDDGGLQSYEVVHIVDGDTVRVMHNGT